MTGTLTTGLPARVPGIRTLLEGRPVACMRWSCMPIRSISLLLCSAGGPELRLTLTISVLPPTGNQPQAGSAKESAPTWAYELQQSLVDELNVAPPSACAPSVRGLQGTGVTALVQLCASQVPQAVDVLASQSFLVHMDVLLRVQTADLNANTVLQAGELSSALPNNPSNVGTLMPFWAVGLDGSGQVWLSFSVLEH